MTDFDTPVNALRNRLIAINAAEAGGRSAEDFDPFQDTIADELYKSVNDSLSAYVHAWMLAHKYRDENLEKHFMKQVVKISNFLNKLK